MLISFLQSYMNISGINLKDINKINMPKCWAIKVEFYREIHTKKYLFHPEANQIINEYKSGDQQPPA